MKDFVSLGRWLAEHPRWLLMAQLVLLHLTLMAGPASALGRSLMMAHLGLFVLWQPFVGGEKKLAREHVMMLFVVVGIAATFLNFGLLTLWVMLLASIIGGKIFILGSRWTRWFHLLALAYLVATLLVFLLPPLLPSAVLISVPLDTVARYFLPMVFLPMLALPGERQVTDRREMIDFAYSVFIFLLLAVVLLGAIAGMLLTGLGYVESLLVVLVVMGGALLFLGWVWSPRGAFSGLGALVSRYLLSANLPFEFWVEHLAAYPLEAGRPEDFLKWACERLTQEITWLSGVAWEDTAGRSKGLVGGEVGQPTVFRRSDICLTLYTAQPLTPMLIWQLNILIHLMEEFFRARQRAQQLRQLSYLQAVYETGSRLTHDIKNLLQSLNTLCVAASREGDQPSPEFQRLLMRQLPTVAQRLQQTLDKLGQPSMESSSWVLAQVWWADVERRFSDQGVQFSSTGDISKALVPSSLFASALENMVQNALEKRRILPSLKVWANLAACPEGVILSVEDDGSPLPQALAEEIGRGPVASDNGLGIGLYQLSRQAVTSQYVLELAENRAGAVRFVLRPATGATLQKGQV
ncbi:MAG: sensor histidine kinase [Rhodocyclaceae bacterium]|nr:sensor histidine kinase [Rhodocyclaceae bacterium]